MNLRLTVPYVWSIYIISTALSLSLQFAGIEHLLMNLEWWGVQIGLCLASLYSYLSARQLYTHGRTWPQKAFLIFFPLSFVHLLFNGPISIDVGLCAVNLLFWWVAYRLSGRLAKLSPYGGPSGYL